MALEHIGKMKKTKPKGKAQIPDKDNPYHTCGKGEIRDVTGTGKCIPLSVWMKKHKGGLSITKAKA